MTNLEKKSDKARLELSKKAEKILDDKGRVVLEFATGVGKTYQALKLIERDGGNWDIVVPTLAILKGWQEEIHKFGMQDLITKVRIYTYQSLHKNASNDDINYCLDECHNVTEKRLDYLIKNVSKDSKIIGLSATVSFERKDLLRDLGINSKNYIKFDTDDAVDAGIVVDYTLWVYKVPIDNKKAVLLPRFKSPMTENKAYAFLSSKINTAKASQNWAQLNFFSIWRKQLISGFHSKEEAAKFFIKRLPSDKKALIFAGNIDQSDRLCEHSYHSKGDQDLLERFKNDEIKVMSSVAKIREGVNAPCDIVIKLGVDSKEKNLVQTIGRALRLNPDDPNKKATAVLIISEATQEEKWLADSIANFKNVRYGKLNK